LEDVLIRISVDSYLLLLEELLAHRLHCVILPGLGVPDQSYDRISSFTQRSDDPVLVEVLVLLLFLLSQGVRGYNIIILPYLWFEGLL